MLTLQNREGRVYTRRLPEIVNAIKAKPAWKEPWIVDGEVVVIGKDGKESFTGSQRRCSTQDPLPSLIREFPVKYEVWDALSINFENLETKPMLDRKALLWKLLANVTEDSKVI